MENIAETQRNYFKTGETLSYSFRLEQLKKLKESITSHEDDLYKSFILDFNKSKFDVYTTEFALVLSELDFQIKHLRKLMKPKKVRTSIINFPSKGKIIASPYGSVLIMSPWNYPFQLTFSPLVGALAAGNTAVVKPSNYTPETSKVIASILSCFDSKYIAVVTGGREENKKLLDSHFDYIFFTGSSTVGKLVMEKASHFLTPVSLELGGKSPCIVTQSSNLKIAAKRIVWGKFINAGQTCIAPDYVLCHESVKKEFVSLCKEQIKKFYYSTGKLDESFPYIVNQKHFSRINSLIDKEKVVMGGRCYDRTIEPTIMENVNYNDPIMSMEIFGPVLPIITYDDINKVESKINDGPTPLSFYVFSNNKQEIKKLLTNVKFGGACVNDTIMHITNDKLPFGGMGESGMGSYHGVHTFNTFSHLKSILIKGKHEINMKYPPKSEKDIKKVIKLMKFI